VACARAGILGRVPRRLATQPAVKDALLRQEASRRAARRANPGRTLGTAGAGGREHAAVAGERGESRRLDTAGDPDVPGRARGDPADPSAGDNRARSVAASLSRPPLQGTIQIPRAFDYPCSGWMGQVAFSQLRAAPLDSQMGM